MAIGSKFVPNVTLDILDSYRYRAQIFSTDLKTTQLQLLHTSLCLETNTFATFFTVSQLIST